MRIKPNCKEKKQKKNLQDVEKTWKFEFVGIFVVQRFASSVACSSKIYRQMQIRCRRRRESKSRRQPTEFMSHYDTVQQHISNSLRFYYCSFSFLCVQLVRVQRMVVSVCDARWHCVSQPTVMYHRTTMLVTVPSVKTFLFSSRGKWVSIHRF